jgi:hypothetical protein
MATASILRDRSPLAILLDPQNDIPLGERDIRLEDYLNDKIQTVTDFESLESLIASVEAQKQQLEDQVSGGRVAVHPKSPTKNSSSLQMPDNSSRQPKTLPRIGHPSCFSKHRNSRDSMLVCRND